MKLGMLAVLPVLFLVQKIDFTDPENIFRAQAVFGVAQTLVILSCVYIYLQINSRNDRTPLTVPPASSPFGGTTGAAQQTNIKDYDLSQLRKFAQQVVIGAGIAVFLFFKWNIVPPMAIQCVLNPINLISHPLFKIFVLGSDPQHHPRPFPEESPFGGLAPSAPAATTTPATPDTTNNNNTTTSEVKKSKKKD